MPKTSIKSVLARICFVIVQALASASVVIAGLSTGILVTSGGGKEYYHMVGRAFGWQWAILLSVVPAGIIAACCGRGRLGLVANALCLVSWFVTFTCLVYSFQGDRPPPSWRATPMPTHALHEHSHLWLRLVASV